jgi:hypothetical protein
MMTPSAWTFLSAWGGYYSLSLLSTNGNNRTANYLILLSYSYTQRDTGLLG